MNEQTRLEFEQLKRKQVQLEGELSGLATRLQRLEADISSEKKPGAFQPSRSPSQPLPAPASFAPLAEPPRPVAAPSAIPPIISSASPIEPPKPALLAPAIEPSRPPQPARPPAYVPPPRDESVPVDPSVAPPKRSFEMRLGTYWLVRIGIVMLLTGLVFFGNYAY
ncbi:MAG: hypothetical protein H7Y43_09670, partial [Akkermansiaceae bacterium]|nr:hypothetical protein [Verrucomicrobiales bacterium]